MDITRVKSFKKLIALTGSIGSGKSEVARLLASKGAFIIDADLLARTLLEKGAPSYDETVLEFGPRILMSNGDIDRRLLGQIVFTEPTLRKKLEKILHPRISELFRSELCKAFSDPANKIVVYVVPLLFETRNETELLEFDDIVTVAASPDIALSRAALRDNCSEEEIKKRYQAQLPIEEKIKRSSIIIYNNGSREDLKQEVDSIWNLLRDKTTA